MDIDGFFLGIGRTWRLPHLPNRHLTLVKQCFHWFCELFFSLNSRGHGGLLNRLSKSPCNFSQTVLSASLVLFMNGTLYTRPR